MAWRRPGVRAPSAPSETHSSNREALRGLAVFACLTLTTPASSVIVPLACRRRWKGGFSSPTTVQSRLDTSRALAVKLLLHHDSARLGETGRLNRSPLQLAKQTTSASFARL